MGDQHVKPFDKIMIFHNQTKLVVTGMEDAPEDISKSQDFQQELQGTAFQNEYSWFSIQMVDEEK